MSDEVREERVSRGPVREFFTEHSESWLDRYSRTDFDSVMYQDRGVAAVRLLAQHARAGGRVLDAGCGAGVQSRAMRAAGFQVVSFDLSPDMARRAKRTLEEAGAPGLVVVADLEALPVRPDSLDAVVSLGVLGYADHPDRVLAGLRDTLGEGGVLVVSSLNREPLLTRISDRLSVVPDAIYLWLKRRVSGRPLPPAPPDDGFYARHLERVDARDFDRHVVRAGFEKRAARSLEFGRPHFMGKRLLPERLEIGLSRGIARIARLPLLGFLDDYARQYVGCFVKTR